MNAPNDRIRDPVCLMWVDPQDHPLEHRGIHYAFCSEQCRERFLGSPGLYVSSAGYHAAAKQQGRQAARRRRWQLRRLPSDTKAEALHAALNAMMGIDGVHIAGPLVEVEYDLLQATAAQIEDCIESQGLRLRGSPWQRLCRGWVHYMEDTQVANMADRTGHSGHHH